MFIGYTLRLVVIFCLIVTLLVGIMPRIGATQPPSVVVYVRRDAINDSYHLYLLDVQSRLSTRLTYFDNSNTQPAWSPDGRYLLFRTGGDFNFTTGRNRNRRIFQMNFLTYTQRLLTTNGRGVNEDSPSWSPTGRIAYAIYQSGHWDIAITHPNSAQTQLVSASSAQSYMNTPANEHTPRWSPDGTHIAYLVGGDFINEIAVADANGMNARILTTGMRVLAGEFDWSPSGTHIAFTSQRDGNIEIYMVNIANGALINLSRHPREDFYPKWSPNQDEIAFISTRNGGQHLFIMTMDGGNIRQITHGNMSISHVNWSPDGQWLVYSAAPIYGYNRHLFIISADGGEPRQLTFSSDDDFLPIWKPK
jgi:TolB protein